MQNLVKVRPQGLRQSVRLEVAASFLHDIKREDVFDLRVPRFRIAVWYEDGQPVVGLGSENISVVNSENPDDLTHLFCVTAFSTLLADGTYEVAMHGATWSHEESENHCCLVQVTRVARSSHAIEIGSSQCCVSKRRLAGPIDIH
ncbi:hypothetical protein [Caballeronia sp. SBC2]|uniref:hypothetical protein n=1 Tax=Caballeronia sp. SBC2 TaxID=2705547 RepID=UPI0013E0F89E|nr:hypothetical protein [Caballeronia sp. SBC2]QIE29736.1 hypothetical protein SBC2_78120 [Caballeronia sp. SBC2]